MRIALLGEACLCLDGARTPRLERKTAGLLAYLALEGGAGRSRLAGLLWPRAPEGTARNNLSQTLKRLKQLADNHALVEGQDRLRLAPAIGVDLLDLLQAGQAGRPDRVANMPGELLADQDYGDCPDFMHWLEERREGLNRLRCEALASLADAVLAAGQPRGALGHLLDLVAADPLSEAAHRRLMRAHAALGDLAASEAAYERCRKLLWQELGVPPSAETRALHREIQDSLTEAPVEPEPLPRRPPHALARPPRLIGRRDELARMQAAWDAHQAIFVTGEAGVGKTRLMQEFLADKPRFHLFEGLPDDPGTPYATYSRTLRQALRAFPGLKLPDWVAAEAARLLPELGGGQLPVDEHDRLRFFHAIAEANDLTVQAGMRTVVVDDLHLVDPASLELGHFVYARQWGRPDGMRSIMLARRDEMSAAGVQAMDWVLDRGYGVEVRLAPLTGEETGALVAGIDPAWTAWAEALYRHVGGNPGMVLETLRALFDAGALGQAPRAPLPVPERMAKRLAARLDRLSADALRLARLAALAEGGLEVAGAASLLERPPAALLDAWSELQAAGLLRDGRPAFDALCQVLVAGIPDPLRRELERQLERL